MGRAPEDEMPLLCELGWHRADPLARWNAGYYFTTCGRCGRDLVRTAYGGWRVPKGFRIVWQTKPPESVIAAELVPEPEFESAASDQMELPIQEVLRQLEAEELEAALASAQADLREDPEEDLEADLFDDGPAVIEGEIIEAEVADTEPEPEWHEAELEPDLEPELQAAELEAELEPELETQYGLDPEPELEPELQPEPQPARRTAAPSAAIDDFMADDWFMVEEPAEDDWDDTPRAPQEPQPEAEAEVDIEDDERERVGNRSGKIRFGKEVASVEKPDGDGLFTMFTSRGPEASALADEEPDPQAATRSSRRAVAATVAASFGVLMLIAAVGGRSETRGDEAAAPAPAAQQAAARPQTTRSAADRTRLMQAGVSQPKETGFVTASLLNCRTAPAEQAEPVRILERGEPVEVLALEPAWASISHEGRQCWASTRYLSADQPL